MTHVLKLDLSADSTLRINISHFKSVSDNVQLFAN